MVTIRLLEALAAIMQVCTSPSRLRVLRDHADAILRAAEQHFSNADDIKQTADRHAACVDAFRRQSSPGN
jgi:uncharacterized membrane protein